MRLNFLLAVVIIAALITSGFFIINYFKKSTTVDELEEQIATSNEEIQELTISKQSLATEIDDLKINQTTIQDAIIAENLTIAFKINSNEIIRNVMELGLENRTSVIPLSNSGWVKVKIQQGDYQVLTLTLTVEGNEPNVINFIRGLEDLYPTLVIESLRISIPITPQTSDSGTPDQTATDGRFYSNLGIAIYSR